MPRAKSEHDTAGPGINKVNVCFAVQRCVNFDAKCEQRILDVRWHFTCSRMQKHTYTLKKKKCFLSSNFVSGYS